MPFVGYFILSCYLKQKPVLFKVFYVFFYLISRNLLTALFRCQLFLSLLWKCHLFVSTNHMNVCLHVYHHILFFVLNTLYTLCKNAFVFFYYYLQNRTLDHTILNKFISKRHLSPICVTCFWLKGLQLVKKWGRDLILSVRNLLDIEHFHFMSSFIQKCQITAIKWDLNQVKLKVPVSCFFDYYLSYSV